MKIMKISENGQRQNQFLNRDVRRLEAIFSDAIDYGTMAIKEMDTWRENGEYDISFDEAKSRLNYYINQMRLK